MNFKGKQMNWVAVISMALLAMNEFVKVGMWLDSVSWASKLVAWANTPMGAGISFMTLAAFGAVIGIYGVVTGGIGGKLFK